MCARCDDYADAVAAARQESETADDYIGRSADDYRENEPCPEGDHDYGEAAEWPDGLVADTDIYCQNCGWTLADIKAKEKADDGS